MIFKCKTTSIVIVILLFSILLSNYNSTFADDNNLPSAATILDKYIEVTGGKAAYEKITNRITKGTMVLTAQGLSLSMTIFAAKPNKTYVVVESDAIGKIESGTINDIVWEKSVMTGARIKEGQEKQDLLREAQFDKFVYWRDIYEKVECVGIEDVASKPCYKVIVTAKGSKPQTFYYDVETNLITKFVMTVENPMGSFPMDNILSDYRKVDGILMAHKSTIKVMGQERTFTITSIEHNADLPDEKFDLPSDIKALLEKK